MIFADGLFSGLFPSLLLSLRDFRAAVRKLIVLVTRSFIQLVDLPLSFDKVTCSVSLSD